MTEGLQPALFEPDDSDTLTLGLYAEQAYLDYAVSVVRGRALPELGDGQKPVQRRILYAMQAMGLAAGSRPVKSARVVGDVLGKYHPHSDQAAYDALVRMAQSFTLRYPLIDGQGNFGSRDGDNAAAMRYTEARLTPFAKLLLDEIAEGTVDFVPNYDGSQQEPVTLPARLPVMLLNGASGIAVGMATEIVPHNLVEVANACVAMIRSKTGPLSVEEVMTHIPGPDFPGAGHIINPEREIAQIYRTGRGTLKVRARWTFEEFARGQWQLVVTELPPGTSGQKVLEEIEEITNPKVRGTRKSLTADQQQSRTQLLSLLDAVRDESGKDAAVRLVFEPKTSRIDREELVNTLLAQTSLETNVAVNLVCVDVDGLPRQMSLPEVLEQWISFREQTLLRRSRFRLDKVLDRIHVLEGRMVVYLNVDEVIRVIREADDPKADLIATFGLTDRQAEDILEMRLRQLARLEGIRIEKELEDKRKEAEKLQELVDKPAALRRLMVREIQADAKQYGDERRTLIEPAERAVLEVRVADEPITIIVSRLGWVRTRQGYGHDASQLQFKAGDACYDTFECRTTDHLVAFGSNGRVYSVPVSTLPSGGRGDGNPLTAMIDLEPGTQLVHFLAAAPQTNWLFSNSKGMGFEAPFTSLMSRQRAGKQFMNLEEDETLLRPLELPAAATYVALLSSENRLAVVDREEIRSLKSGGRGTVMIGLDEGASLEQVAGCDGKSLEIQGIFRKRERVDTLSGDTLAAHVTRRANKGRVLQTRLNSPKLVGLSSS